MCTFPAVTRILTKASTRTVLTSKAESVAGCVSATGYTKVMLEYEVTEPLRSVDMRYDGEVLVLDDPELLRDPRRLFSEAPRQPCAVEFSLEGLSPVHGGEPVTADQQTMYGRDFSLGHFFQHTRTTGTIRVGADEWSIDGLGWRDHSWGPRHWTNINFYRLFIANFGEDFGITVLKITDREARDRCGLRCARRSGRWSWTVAY